MRYNKQELLVLASQTSQNFDREGVLVVKEKQEGFFRRSEGCSVRWFRLRGNLLFYLKGPEPWYEPMGVIVLGNHQVKLQAQDENGHWPFQIVWENSVSYKMATFHESERVLWLKAIQMAPYDKINSQIADLKERLNQIRPIVDLRSYREQKGIIIDMNEIPLCELALSCDNLLCDAYGRPPSPVIVVYVKLAKGLCLRYGATEIVESCSNPSFSKTVLFRASDGVAGDALVRLVAYDVRERVSETRVPMGYTSLRLNTMQEAQRLRVALQNKDNKTVGFVTLNGWSLEPAYIGTSPSHTDRNCVDIPQKVLCHRRSQSLPPRLGLKLKFPSYGSLLKQNFVNSTQATYRFHSGLGGDITVYEQMAEAKICFQMPMQFLDIFIQREKELLEGLVTLGDVSGPWQTKLLELAGTHISLLKHYCHSKRYMKNMGDTYFKASSRKGDAGLEFAPTNLHLQRMWVYNDTLNKTGFHDVITAGAFHAHTHKHTERTGGLIRLVQQVKDVSSTRAALNSATANKIQAEFECVVAARSLRDHVTDVVQRALVLLQAGRGRHVTALLEDIKAKMSVMISMWQPRAVEESLSLIGWSKANGNCDTENQTMTAITRLTEQLSAFEASPDCDAFDITPSSSSKEASPTTDHPTLSASVPAIYNAKNITDVTELNFCNDYFKSEREERMSNHSFRSVRSPKPKLNEAQCLSFEGRRHGSFRRLDFKSSASLEQVSYRDLMDGLGASESNKLERRESVSSGQDEAARADFACLQRMAGDMAAAVDAFMQAVGECVDRDSPITEDELEHIRSLTSAMLSHADAAWRWLRTAHAAQRLRSEPPAWAKDHAALQARRDTCFSQALTTASAGLLCWLNSVPGDVVSRVLSSGLGPLCAFEGLLSLHATEKAMWGDMVVAVEDLHTVSFVLEKVTHSNTVLPYVSGTRGAVVVHIPISDSLYAKIEKKEHLKFNITAVFFNIGINEKATLAEALGETAPQRHSNCDSLERLHKYYHRHRRVFPQEPTARASSRTKPLEEVMENLRIAVNKRAPKNAEVLHLAALATRLMNGIRFTSCKSAKDRTAMSVTLEQCNILASEYHLAENEMKKALNIMRSEGCRRENTFKNIGIRKYAFTKKQTLALPEDYRPPAGTYGSSHS